MNADLEHLFRFIVDNFGYIAAIMSVIVSLLVEGIKIPIKLLTKKIQNEQLRKLANKSIIMITFGLGFLIDYLGSVILPKYVAFDSLVAVIIGLLSVVLYSFFEGIIPMKAAEKAITGTKTVTEYVKKEAEETHKKDAVAEFKKICK